MKKISILTMIMISFIVLMSCEKKKDLIIYIIGAYINPEVINEFQRETGKTVGVVNFEDNESALMQLNDQSNKYDVVVPSDYAIEELAKKNLIEEINWNLITNIKENDFVPNLKESLNSLKNQGFDYLKYAVPYFWGTVGFLYNKNTVENSNNELDKKGWNIFEEEQYKAVLYDSSRDAYLMALRKDGSILNDADQTRVDTATAWLKNINRRNNVDILGDQILDAPDKLDYDLIQVYSGDAVYIMEKNSNYKFHKPQNTNIWVDGIAIPKNSDNKELAHQFINFLMSEKILRMNALEVCYTTPSSKVFNELIGSNFANYMDAYDVTLNPLTDEFFRYNDNLKKMLDEGWIKIKNR